MKIYVGKNKKEAKETSLKDLIDSLTNKRIDRENDCFNDDSGSWLNFKFNAGKEEISVILYFDVEEHNSNWVESINVYSTPYTLDHDKTKRIV